MESILQLEEVYQWAIIITLGCIYGGLIGLIPSAGAGKAIILLFGVVGFFDGAEYLFVLFSMVTVVACSIGDSYASVLLGVPGQMERLQQWWMDIHLQRKVKHLMLYPLHSLHQP